MALPLPKTFTAAFTAERANRIPKKQRTPLLIRAGRAAARILPTRDAFRRATLSVTGFACLTAAAWTITTWAGLAAAGASLLILEWLTGSDA